MMVKQNTDLYYCIVSICQFLRANLFCDIVSKLSLFSSFYVVERMVFEFWWWSGGFRDL
jgi:hypothetical protein